VLLRRLSWFPSVAFGFPPSFICVHLRQSAVPNLFCFPFTPYAPWRETFYSFSFRGFCEISWPKIYPGSFSCFSSLSRFPTSLCAFRALARNFYSFSFHDFVVQPSSFRVFRVVVPLLCVSQFRPFDISRVSFENIFHPRSLPLGPLIKN
jgi:hypothetical protein